MTIEIRIIGAKKVIAYIQNGNDILVENYSASHELFGINPEDITPEERIAIYRKTGFLTAISEYQIRRRKIDKVIIYLRAQATPAMFQTILNDTRTYREDYRVGSDILISWIRGENSPVYGNFLLTGFPSKGYFSVARQTELLSILTI